MVDAAKKAEMQMDKLEAMADAWAEEVDLTDMVSNVTSPMNLRVDVPADVRTHFHERMKAQVFAIAQQAFIEGAGLGIELVNGDLRSAELVATLRQIANGRKEAPSGSQRICRDELKTMARDACVRLGIDWQQ